MLNFWTFFDPFPSQRLSEFFYWPSFIDDLPFLNSGTMKGCPYSDSLSVFMCYNSNLTCTHNFSFYIIFFALVCNSLTNDDSFSLIIWKIRWLFCRKKKSYMAVFPFISLIKGVLSYSGEGTGMLLDFRIYRFNCIDPENQQIQVVFHRFHCTLSKIGQVQWNMLNFY